MQAQVESVAEVGFVAGIEAGFAIAVGMATEAVVGPVVVVEIQMRRWWLWRRWRCRWWRIM